MKHKVEIIEPNKFDQQNHFYPKALNTQLHAMVSHFFNLDHERIIKRYSHLHPQVDPEFLREILKYKCKHFFWGGSDLFYVTTEAGNRRMVVLETNSCPSGQKSMPERTDADEHRGYKFLVENSFIPELKKRRLPEGGIAVIYDKNYMEVSGYAATLADSLQEEVFLVPFFNNEKRAAEFRDGILYVNVPGRGEVPIRAALRYVTQKPWNRIPIDTKTFIYNSTLVCLSGGRNKLVANKAYEFFNSEISSSGLKINMPQTIRDVSKGEIPLWIQRFGGYAVIKNPYSNAGQGVYTITSQKELDAFMAEDYAYDQFIVQSLIGHYDWSSKTDGAKYFHIGTIPNKRGQIYVADLRMMVYSSPDGFYPCAIYARRAKEGLKSDLKEVESSWDVLGTNLSVKLAENEWSSDTSRLMLMDRKDFNSLGIGTDDLIDGYIQTILSIIAIDKMCQHLVNKKGNFKMKLFQSLDNDKSLLKEIMS